MDKIDYNRRRQLLIQRLLGIPTPNFPEVCKKDIEAHCEPRCGIFGRNNGFVLSEAFGRL